MSEKIVSFKKYKNRNRQDKNKTIEVSEGDLKRLKDALDNLHLWSNCYKCSNYSENYNLDVLGSYSILNRLLERIERAMNNERAES